MESNIFTYLEAQATVTAQVGTSPDERIYSGDRPQGSTLPALTIALLDGEYWHDLGSASGMSKAMIAITSWSTTKQGARTLSEIIRGEMAGYTSAVGQMGSLDVHYVELLGETERRERKSDASDSFIVGIVQDYLMSHDVSIPTF